MDTWLTPLKGIRKTNEAELNGIADEKQRAIRLAELNVEAGVQILLSNHVVDEAVQERGLRVHGVLYDIGCGKIRDLGVGNAGSVKGKALGQEEEVEIVKGNHGQLVFREGGAAMSVR